MRRVPSAQLASLATVAPTLATNAAASFLSSNLLMEAVRVKFHTTLRDSPRAFMVSISTKSLTSVTAALLLAGTGTLMARDMATSVTLRSVMRVR